MSKLYVIEKFEGASVAYSNNKHESFILLEKLGVVDKQDYNMYLAYYESYNEYVTKCKQYRVISRPMNTLIEEGK